MSEDILQIDYDQMATIADQFQVQSESVEQMARLLNTHYGELKNEGWVGQAADAFFDEFETELEPALNRLYLALEAGSVLCQQVAQRLSGAEEEAAAQVNFDAEAAFGIGAAVGGRYYGYGNNVLSASSGGAFTFGPANNTTSQPLSPWYTAPFAAVSSFLSRGAVPAGRVGGQNLWLYIGGSGDTIFSVHPRASGVTGWWRAPRFDNQITKPLARFDYGTVPVNKGNLPNGGKATIVPNKNYFHWNHKGGAQTFNLRNHQLMTNNINPRPNMIGRITGSPIVRGASRGLVVTGVAMDVYSVATADNKVEEGVRRGVAWGGAWAGAKGGAAVGATIGTFIAPGIGTAVGGAVGGVVGGVGGYIAGYEIGDEVYEYGGKAIDAVTDFGGDVIDGAGDLLDAGLSRLGF